MDYYEEKKDVFRDKEGGNVTVVPVETYDGEESGDVKVDVHTGIYDGVRRTMKQRHMQMLALAGTLGTGLFLGSGKAIAHAGPAGALLAYMLIGSVTYCMMLCVGEMTVFAPISGGYIHQAERYVDPALGFALGWQCWFSGVISLPTEIISATIILSYWDTAFPISHQAAYITALLLATSVINFMGARWFGESEFIFALIKICLIVGLIIAGLIVDLGGVKGQDRIGFRYWKDPGAFADYVATGSLGKFLGFFQTLLQAAYSYLGMEAIAVAAAEVENPRKSVAKAVKRIFVRIVAFYVLGILIIGMLVPYNDSHLLQSTGTAASSPFVVAFSRAGIKVLPSIINACVLTSAFSAGNTGLYQSSRQLYGLALRGQAPKIFAKTTKKGLPITALLFSVMFITLSYMALSEGASTALNYLSNLTSLSGFITWGTISITYIRFRKGIDTQGIDRKSWIYYSRLQPYAAWWCLFWCVINLFFNGWQYFVHGYWSTSGFIMAYINVPIFIILFAGWKFYRKTKFWTPMTMDFYSNVPGPEIDLPEPKPKTFIGKVANILFT